MEGQVPNISEPNRGGINEKGRIRRGRVCIVPTVNSQSSGSLRSLYYTSLAIHGPRLFNSVPATSRNMTDCSVDTFKAKMYAIASDKHQLQFPKLHHFKLERI